MKPGEIVSIDLGKTQFSISKFNYWNIEDYQDEKNFNEEEFFDIFSESVKLRIEADVGYQFFIRRYRLNLCGKKYVRQRARN